MMMVKTKDKTKAGSQHCFRGELREHESMDKHTSWRAGGAVSHFYKPADVEDLAQFIAQFDNNEPLMWLGLGSNLLVRDGGLPGTVISTSGILNGLQRTGENTVRVEAGVPSAKLARYCAREGLAGTAFLAGIPGTMGGALAMNAGALGSEIWDLVTKVETMDNKGDLHIRTPDEFEIAYRHVRGPEQEWFIAAHLELADGESEQLLQEIKDVLTRRAATQPTGQSSCGSVFRNPDGDYAGRLIEDCGLKGYCIGGACVSEKHANFIVNTGQATALDIESLIDYVAKEVKAKHGVALIREVHIIGATTAEVVS